MAGYIAEFFGYRAEDRSPQAREAIREQLCPFIGRQCTKTLSRSGIPSGVCALRQKTTGSPVVICCPNRLYAANYAILRNVAHRAFGSSLPLYPYRTARERAAETGGSIAVFGKGWGGELHLPQRKGSGSYFVDWVLARLDELGNLVEFTAAEVQTIDTTGSYQQARARLLGLGEVVADTVGLNWENVNKRIIPQLIYKGQVLQREEICKAGLFFISPKPVHDRIIARLGGKNSIPTFPQQPASIHFIAYDYNTDATEGIVPLEIIEEHCTTVYKVQEAFSSLTLPEGNIYRDAIVRCLEADSNQKGTK